MCWIIQFYKPKKITLLIGAECKKTNSKTSRIERKQVKLKGNTFDTSPYFSICWLVTVLHPKMSNVGEKSKDGGGGVVHRNRERLAQYYGGENTTDPSTTSATTATPASSSVTRYICTLLFFELFSLKFILEVIYNIYLHYFYFLDSGSGFQNTILRFKIQSSYQMFLVYCTCNTNTYLVKSSRLL